MVRAFSRGDQIFLQNGFHVLALQRNPDAGETVVKRQPPYTFWGVVQLQWGLSNLSNLSYTKYENKSITFDKMIVVKFYLLLFPFFFLNITNILIKVLLLHPSVYT